MRKPLITLGIAWIAVVPAHAVTPDDPDTRTITVSGAAEVKVVPDEVVMTLSIETRNLKLAEAKKLHDERVRATLALAPKLKFTPDQFATDYVSIRPEYQYNQQTGKQEFYGYVARQTMSITLNDISRYQETLTAILDAGATSINGVEFRTTKLREHRDRARAMAIRAAKDKAVALAGELTQMVGQPLQIIECAPEFVPSFGNQLAQVRTQADNDSDGMPDAADQTIAPGRISVKSRVQVTFALIAAER